MTEHLLQLVSDLTDHPVKQALLAAFCTFIFEDPTTIGCGLLVADGRMSFWTAMAGLTLGITIGDLGLYYIGRFFGPWIIRRGWISQERVRRAKVMVDDNLLVAIVLSRFLPGTRIPTFVGAGLFGASAWRFLFSALLASTLWTYFLLTVTVHLGRAILPFLGEMKWYVVLAVLVTFLVYRLATHKRRKLRAMAVQEAPEQVVSLFEFWPPAFFYLPVAAYYVWLSIRYRSFSLPSLANPSIYSGGICRESKSQILGLVPEKFSRFIAGFTTFKKHSPHADSKASLLEVRGRMEEAGLEFPIVAKPDEGQRGAGVRLIRDEEALAAYVREFPASVPILLQKLVDYPGEAGVLYYRHPGEKTGKLLSLTLKDLPSVTGDGASTLRELILGDPRARLISEVYFRRHAGRLDSIIADGERFPLVFTGNHCQGAIFRDGTPLITEELRAAFALISDEIPEFYFGRFDVKFKSLESFLRGEDFEVVEINGASAEATHIWDAKMKLTDAYRTLFRQFEILFEIGDANRRRGFKPIGGLTILKDAARYYLTSKHYPSSS